MGFHMNDADPASPMVFLSSVGHRYPHGLAQRRLVDDTV